MSTPVIPTLMSDVSLLSSPTDIIKYVLRSYMTMPKNINDTFASTEISFRYDDAENGHDPYVMRQVVETRLRSVLSRYFANNPTLNINVDTVRVDDNGYNIRIDVVVVVDGIAHSVGQDFTVDENGNLVYEFRGD